MPAVMLRVTTQAPVNSTAISYLLLSSRESIALGLRRGKSIVGGG